MISITNQTQKDLLVFLPMENSLLPASMETQPRSSKPNQAFTEYLHKFVKCFSCGRCVGDCPAANHSDFNIRLLIQDLMVDYDSVLKRNTIWQCLQCDYCRLVCPVSLEPSELIRILRFEATKRGFGLPRLRVLKEFYDNVQQNGIIFPVSEAITRARSAAGLSTPNPFVNPRSPGYRLLETLSNNTPLSSARSITPKKRQQRRNRN